VEAFYVMKVFDEMGMMEVVCDDFGVLVRRLC